VSSAEQRILDAAKRCCELWGIEKVTVDDIAAAARVSRATLYRVFPGGKDVLFEALRVRELDDFFLRLRAGVADTDTLEDLVVRSVVVATNELRADEHLALMLASEPGDVLGQLTVEGLPRIIAMATATLTPRVSQYLPPDAARQLIDLLARLTISYFLAPSDDLDLGNESSARDFLRPVIQVLAASPAI
jgi:AcrR family transcriptional regulator